MINTFLKITAIASLVSLSSLASAEWTVGGGYANYGEDEDGLDISLGVIYGSVGYTYESGNMTFMPELRLGTGISDDNVSVFGIDVDVEVDSFVAASIRGQYNVTESFGVFLQPSYGRLEATLSAQGITETEDAWEFGFGGGASFKVSETASIEALYEAFDGTDVVSIGLRMTF